jgi:large subunit ribosomal protein L10
MDKKTKEKLVADIRGRLDGAEGAFLVDYQGLNVQALSQLRKALKEVNADFQVVKNRLLNLASQDTTTGVLRDDMRGPSALAIAYEDIVAPAKVLVGFANTNERLKIKKGQISGKVMDERGIRRLAELPAKEVLLAQALSAMQAVPASFVRVLNGVIAKLLYVLKAIEQEKTGPA